MMRLLFFIASFVLIINTSLANIHLKSNQVTLSDLIYLYYKDFTSQNIILDDSIDSLTKLYRFDVNSMSQEELSGLLNKVLEQNQVYIKDLGGTLFFYVDKDKSLNTFDDIDEIYIPEVPAHVLDSNNDVLGGFIDGLDAVRSNLIFEYDSVATYIPKYLDIDFVTGVVNQMTGMTYSHNGYMVPIFGSDEVIEKVLNFLEVIDVPTPQVRVKALLLEYTDSKADRSGFTLALKALSDKLSLTFGTITGIANAFSFKNANIDLIASMIQDDNRFKIISSPSVLVTSGSKARFHVGSSVPVLDSEYITDRDAVRKAVIYKDSGVLLDVGAVVKRNRVDLTIRQEISDFQTTKTSNIDSPTLSQRSFASTLQLVDGETIAIAGLDEWKASEARSGLWFLPRLFDSVEKREDFSQIVLLLTVDILGAN